MKLRNVQKTGNMFYIYLPSKWCRDKNIDIGSRIELDLDSSGNLVLLAQQKQDTGKDIKLDLKEDDMYILSKLIMSCFLNPTKSFEIGFTKTLNQKQILHQKKLVSTTFIEVDKHRIYSESVLSISNTLSMFIAMLKKVQNLTKVMIENYDVELIERYEEEIDRSNVLITKAVIASFMHKRESKLKPIELHYVSLLSTYLERMTDHLITIEKIDKNEKLFLKEVADILDEFSNMVKMIQENDPSFDYNYVVNFTKKVKSLKVSEKVFREVLLKDSLKHSSEVLMDWAISRLVLE
ncbi:MAG: PhoU domain-containing protein [Nanoarchaeota archaeon]|nr:PhoU domain-containing protein [Nanoarchaeota archaeon]MCG2717886.1 PhoU domain-containing protein [Nanoarchaeota archaeon]